MASPERQTPGWPADWRRYRRRVAWIAPVHYHNGATNEYAIGASPTWLWLYKLDGNRLISDSAAWPAIMKSYGDLASPPEKTTIGALADRFGDAWPPLGSPLEPAPPKLGDQQRPSALDIYT